MHIGCPQDYERRHREAENRDFGFIPSHDLLAYNTPIDLGKYYAVARGRFLGVFTEQYVVRALIIFTFSSLNSAMYHLAVDRVSSPLHSSPAELHTAIAWFNRMRSLGLCEIVF